MRPAIIVVDVETTGFHPEKDRIVEIAASILRYRQGVFSPGPTFARLVNPGRPIPPASAKVHQITDADVEGADDLAVTLAALQAFFQEHEVTPRVWIGHNIAFDWRFLGALQAAYPDTKTLCTLQLARRLFLNTGLENFKNQTLKKAWNIDIRSDLALLPHAQGKKRQQAHSAGADVLVSAYVFQHIYRHICEAHPDIATIDALIEWAQESPRETLSSKFGPIPKTPHSIQDRQDALLPTQGPVSTQPEAQGAITIMPWGKYRDEAIASLCRNRRPYVQWVIENARDRDVVGVLRAELRLIDDADPDEESRRTP